MNKIGLFIIPKFVISFISQKRYHDEITNKYIYGTFEKLQIIRLNKTLADKKVCRFIISASYLLFNSNGFFFLMMFDIVIKILIL